MATAAEIAAAEAQIQASRAAYNALFSKTESEISSLKTRAMSRYFPDLSQVGFDGQPTWEVNRGRDTLSAGTLSLDLPEFNFDGDLADAFQAMGLERYSYRSDFFDNFLDSRLRDWIDSQGYFLAQSVQDALFEQTRERDLRTTADALRMTDRLQARRGFPMPHDMMKAARADVIEKHRVTQVDRNKEFTVMIADKALQEKLEAVRSGVQMEDIRSRFQLEYNKLYWQSTDYVIKKYELKLRSALAGLDKEIKQHELSFRSGEFNAKLDLDYEGLVQTKQLNRLNTLVTELQQNVATWAKSVDMEIKAAEDAVQFYANAALGTSGQINIVRSA